MGFQNQNFVESLAKAVSQSLAGVQQQQQVASAPARGQNQVGIQPQQHLMNQQNMMNPQQQQQQPAMIPMMMIPNGQNMFFPAQQGRPGL